MYLVLDLAPPAPEGWDKDLALNTQHHHPQHQPGYAHASTQHCKAPRYFLLTRYLIYSILVMSITTRAVVLTSCPSPWCLSVLHFGALLVPRPRPRRVGIKSSHTTSTPSHSTTSHSSGNHLSTHLCFTSSLVVISPLPLYSRVPKQ